MEAFEQFVALVMGAGGLVADGLTRWHWDSREKAALEDVVVHCARGYAVGTSVVAKVSRPVVRPRAFEIGIEAVTQVVSFTGTAPLADRLQGG